MKLVPISYYNVVTVLVILYITSAKLFTTVYAGRMMSDDGLRARPRTKAMAIAGGKKVETFDRRSSGFVGKRYPKASVAIIFAASSIPARDDPADAVTGNLTGKK